MNNERVLSLLGIARKAGRLSVGFAASKAACLSKKAYFVAVASDISEKSEKEIKYFAKGNIPVERIPYTISDVSVAIGIKAGIVAVCDEGLAAALSKDRNTSEKQL